MFELEALQSDAVQAFGRFADHLSFTKAARSLHISQPSLHVKIQKLSRTLGVELYERVGRQLQLTPEGVQLAAFARAQEASALDFLAELATPSSLVTIASGRGALLWVVGDAVRDLVSDGLDARVLPADRAGALALLANGTADVAVIASDPPPREFQQRCVATFRQHLFVPSNHELARRKRLHLSNLHGIELVAPPPNKPQRQMIERAFMDADIAWSVAAEVDGWDLIVHLVSIGLGGAIINGCVVAPHGVVSIPIVDLPTVSYWLAWRASRATTAQLFVERCSIR
jgi:LysR family transcriptional regulator, low CO2-responsive transcriptional regulator